MDVNVERECSALGGLFHQIITDMKNGAPLWEDLISKATKLHACLKAAILAVSAYLDAFQKIADAATNARGATKEIGTALTRICLRHKAVETRMKSFTCAIMDRLVMPLQEKLEDWKKTLLNLDKEHAKEYKKAKSELKKRSTDTLRLQKKKARKGIVPPSSHGVGGGGIHNHMSSAGVQGNRIDDAELNRLLESSAAVVHEKRVSLEETERKAVRSALLEERGRFCHLAKLLKPVLDEEIAMLMELTHLQEVSDQLERHATAPYDLPAASEQVIIDLKGRECTTQWALATPPSSPSLSLGSRKSSMCSISSLTSSSSGSCKNHPSPCGHPWHRSLSQPLGTSVTRSTSFIVADTNGTMVKPLLRHLSTGSSRDSGFTSQDTLYRQPINENQVSNVSSQSNQSGPGGAIAMNANQRQLTNATWPDLQETSGQYNSQSGQQSVTINERPHTISSAYEKGGLHQRPALSVYTFQPPDPTGCCHSQPASPVSASNPQLARVQLRKNSAGATARPPIPNRCSSLERPTSTSSMNDGTASHRGKPKLPIPAHLAKELGNHQLAQQPMYVNMHELASLAANRAQEMQIPAASGRTTASPASNSSGGGGGSSSATIEKTESTTSKEKLITTNQMAESSLDIKSTCTLPRRDSLQQPIKPPPPTRRTSTIISTSTSGSLTDGVVDSGILLTTVASSGADERERPLETSNVSSIVTDETENLPPPPAFLLEGNSPTVSPTPQRSISVSETVRTLTELRHTPASPSFLRKAAIQQAQTSVTTAIGRGNTEILNSTRRISTSAIESGQLLLQASNTVSQGFMAVLNSKLTSNSNINTAITSECSPKLLRKHITLVEQQTSINSRAPSGFLETLNAKLSVQKQQQQPQHQRQLHSKPQQHIQIPQLSQQQSQPVKLTSTSRSASVRRIMANRVPIIDPLQVRDSLMDQIRRGTSLRKTSGSINDRSAPQIY
ncbi:hypothetical protein PV325_001520 [Microctonus aethiopoides]|nr:hypothetical protein PV325_001520 [Microctonus aethiopoides]